MHQRGVCTETHKRRDRANGPRARRPQWHLHFHSGCYLKVKMLFLFLTCQTFATVKTWVWRSTALKQQNRFGFGLSCGIFFPFSFHLLIATYIKYIRCINHVKYIKYNQISMRGCTDIGSLHSIAALDSKTPPLLGFFAGIIFLYSGLDGTLYLWRFASAGHWSKPWSTTWPKLCIKHTGRGVLITGGEG